LPSVTRYAFAFTLDLIVRDNRCVGATVLKEGKIISIFAKIVILATGGAGQLFSRTTNPLISTGDGIAIAYRAGALIVDMEFVQFHPTTLYSPGAPQFLLSEAMRGEGALLKNVKNERFMPGYHDMSELAPRDAVTRAIVSEMVKTKTRRVYLDLRHLDKNFVKKRFPLIYATCLQYDIDITEDMIPVSPAAHYVMGGVSTNTYGETSLKGLFAAGEVACTGVHGANRLASNSLLEGLVFGARVGKKASQSMNKQKRKNILKGFSNEQSRETVTSQVVNYDIEKIRSSLRQLMWNKVGIIRCEKSLSCAERWIHKKDFIINARFQDRRGCELKNMLTVAHLITEASILRKGSVGAHYRSDFKKRDENRQRHTACERGKAAHWLD
jgi:L-aspartate oxidase